MQTPKETPSLLKMTSETIGRDILQALIQEIQLLPDAWPKLSKFKQDEIIDRMRSRVDTNIRTAVNLIAGEDRPTIQASLDQITIKDGIKAVLQLSKHDPNRYSLCDAQGKAVLIVVADASSHIEGMDSITGESDQRAMDLGHEYDPNSDANVIDVVAKALEHQILQEERDKAFACGKLAARKGETQAACPLMAGELCIEWIKGWKAFHAELTVRTETLGELPNENGVYTCRPDEVLRWQSKTSKDNVEIQLLKLEDGTWIFAKKLEINKGFSSSPLSRQDYNSAQTRALVISAAKKALENEFCFSHLKGAALASFKQWFEQLGAA